MITDKERIALCNYAEMIVSHVQGFSSCEQSRRVRSLMTSKIKELQECSKDNNFNKEKTNEALDKYIKSELELISAKESLAEHGKALELACVRVDRMCDYPPDEVDYGTITWPEYFLQQARKQLKNGEEKGLYNKYIVSRTDGKPITDGCIILEWSDPIAREAIRAFAGELNVKGYVKLADDLEERLEKYDS